MHLPAFAAGQTRAAGVLDGLEQFQNVVGRSGRDRSGQPTEVGNVPEDLQRHGDEVAGQLTVGIHGQDEVVVGQQR